jgi:hypothetical protein
MVMSAYEQLQISAAAAEEMENLKARPEQAKNLKREEAEANDDASVPDVEAPAPVVTTTRAGRASKTATPLSSTFPELGARNRVVRNKDNSGSHASSESGERSRRGKKSGAGSAAASIRADNDIIPDEASDVPDEPEADEADLEDADMEGVEEEDEPKYCYCQQVSYGEMVACDNDACEKEWFHLKCAGLSRAPDENSELLLEPFAVRLQLLTCGAAKWYCDDCKAKMKGDTKRSRPVSRRE